MKKVNWRWDWGCYVPLCPYCDELVHDTEKCVFCGKKYEWVEGKIKPTKVDHEGYTIIQSAGNHLMVYKDGQIVLYASCTQKMTEKELRDQIDFIKEMRKERL